MWKRSGIDAASDMVRIVCSMFCLCMLLLGPNRFGILGMSSL
jgi:hypothetical protein